VGLEGAQAALCQDFLGWQCRLRQMAMRHDQGRPSAGMRPTVILPDGQELGTITVLITRREPEETTAQFRHMVLKTNDPADRYANALRLLQAGYYQESEEFSDVLSALFSGGSPTCRRILEAGRCVLRFRAPARPTTSGVSGHLLAQQPVQPGHSRRRRRAGLSPRLVGRRQRTARDLTRGVRPNYPLGGIESP
jgi:hypothetical protein